MSTSGFADDESLSENTSLPSSTLRDETVSPSIVTAAGTSASASSDAGDNTTESIVSVDESPTQDLVANITEADRPSVQASPSSNYVGRHIHPRVRRRLIGFHRIQQQNILLFMQIQEEMYRVSSYEAVIHAPARRGA
ncbi:hypothetical protein CYLTODRAFT_413947 [Cylindrobasidium torrendii FP15055 ss-10]|uniref:Uncharacterized protein n=1 Tax=Cylindrobasidium torrendii FP15055 ss-10 TaxID=1314674 RepID=A0A0D7B078_9AGAR|nr:hypothetical protein CYLTODRAFT_413947 [Cylindrobasidium torrendii FP15055 ss-10]